MLVGITNNTVYSYAATENGLSSANYSGDANGKSYVMTMKFHDSLAFYAGKIRVRAYAKLSDGTYTYSTISTKSVYEIADELYQNSDMRNEEEHNYLYDKILSVVNHSYEKVNYVDNVVEQETTVDEVTKVEESTTTVPDGYTVAGGEWNNLNYWSVYFASGWAGDPTGYYKDGNSYNDFSVKINTASNAEWGVQLKTQPIDVEAGNTYKCVVTAESNMDSTSNIRFKDDISEWKNYRQ